MTGCDSDHCVTCGDAGVEMWVVAITTDDAVCVEADGTRHEGIAVELVAPVLAGDRVIVHAGVAIA